MTDVIKEQINGGKLMKYSSLNATEEVPFVYNYEHFNVSLLCPKMNTADNIENVAGT